MALDGEAVAEAWAVLGGAESLLRFVSYDGPHGLLSSRLPVMSLGRASVAACSLAAAELLSHRSTGERMPAVRVHEGAVAAAFRSERLLRIDGRPTTSFAPLSRFWPTADGWLRTHANYPHHRSRLLSALGVTEQQDIDRTVAAIADVLASTPAKQAEETIFAAGGLAVAVRTADEWAAHPQGRAAAAQPLVRRHSTGESVRRTTLAPSTLPADGLRVLDLTRVIAGPVATRTLALLGADVLRIDSPNLPEDPDAHADSGFGKRSVALDLGRRADRRTFENLLCSADVVVTGYRPGALDRYGLSAPDLTRRRPSLIVAQLSAWGFDGPWSGRRGFDSLVQAASGISLLERAANDAPPGALPAQALDHSTGYLLAAAALRAITDRLSTGTGWQLRLSLATTASWLMRLPGPADLTLSHVEPDAAEPWLTRTQSPLGTLCHAKSPISYDGAPTNWKTPPGLLGTDQPTWRTAPD
jgi:crotonobetainyl-CoA:carnitine CoA-transferase CaiB-like acyl-CoA transferase